MSIVVDHLVPPARLAALMVERRSDQGLDLVDMARRSNGLFTPSYLQDAERGRLELTSEVIDRLLALYEVDAGPIIPQRHQLVLDLNSRQLSVGNSRTRFDSIHTDDVLERYVSLIYHLRGLKSGSDLVLRDRDLDVLGQGLGHSQDELRAQILEIIEAPDSVLRAKQVGGAKMVAAAGILVGITAVGTLVLVGSGPSMVQRQGDVAASPTLVSASGTGDSVTSAARTAGIAGTFTTPSVAGSFVSDLAPSAPVDDIATPAVQFATDPGPVDIDGDTQTEAAPQSAVTQPPEAVAPEVVAPEVVAPEVGEPEVVAPEAVAPEAVAPPTAVPAAPGDAVEATVIETEEQTNGTAPALGDAIETAVIETPLVESAAVALSPAELGARVEAQLGYRFRDALPGWRFEWTGDSPTHRGLTFSREKRIVMYVEPGSTIGSLTEVFMHEVGHAIDLEHMTNAKRTEWLEMRNMPMAWWPGNGLTDFAVGAGDFAEAVAAVTVGSTSYSTYGPFTGEQLAFVANILGGA